jgi:hypothetical protein
MVAIMIVDRNRRPVSGPLENLDDESRPMWSPFTRRQKMRSFWEQTGVLGPIYRLLGEGLNDEDIALKLDLTEAKVRDCIAWIVHFLELKSRQELVAYASTAA